MADIAAFPGAFGAASWDQLKQERILGLTVKNPWGWSIAKGLKPIENRRWAPPKAVLGKYIAIHAGKTYDDADACLAFADCCQHPLVQPRLTKAIGEGAPLNLGQMPMSSVLSVARLARVVDRPDHLTAEERVWWVGPFAWVLEDVVELSTPVPCRGAQKLWALPPGVLELVRQRYAAAKAARKAS